MASEKSGALIRTDGVKSLPTCESVFLPITTKFYISILDGNVWGRNGEKSILSQLQECEKKFGTRKVGVGIEFTNATLNFSEIYMSKYVPYYN